MSIFNLKQDLGTEKATLKTEKKSSTVWIHTLNSFELKSSTGAVSTHWQFIALVITESHWLILKLSKLHSRIAITLSVAFFVSDVCWFFTDCIWALGSTISLLWSHPLSEVAQLLLVEFLEHSDLAVVVAWD